jgi:putative membrane protein
MMGWNDGGMTGIAWIGMGLFWLVLLGLIVWLVIRLLPGRSQESQPASGTSTAPAAAPTASPSARALTILDERLATGEVDVETYRTIRATLLEGREGER